MERVLWEAPRRDGSTKVVDGLAVPSALGMGGLADLKPCLSVVLIDGDLHQACEPCLVQWLVAHELVAAVGMVVLHHADQTTRILLCCQDYRASSLLIHPHGVQVRMKSIDEALPLVLLEPARVGWSMQRGLAR